MLHSLTATRNAINWGSKGKRTKTIALGLAVALLVWLAGSGMVPAAQAALPMQPELLAALEQNPDAPVSVIVQKTARDDRVEQWVARLGGTVTRDLSMINAFAAEAPGRAVPAIALSGGVRWISLDEPVRQSAAGPAVFTTWATTVGTAVPNGFADAASMVDSTLGANTTFGSGGAVKGAFTGFEAQVTPGNAITKAELLLVGYTPALLKAGDDPTVFFRLNGKTLKSFVLNHHAFDTYVGAANTGTAVLDVTASHAWKWGDFDGDLQLVIDQSKFGSGSAIYYDAIGLRVTSAPGTDTTGGTAPTNLPKGAIDVSKLANVYARAVRAPEIWNDAALLQGQGVTVAVVDSGIAKNSDLDKRLIAKVNLNQAYHDSADRYGHGTFVASVVAGDGKQSGGQRIGIAPKTNVINVRISDDQGMAYESDVVDALQWVYNNKSKYKIRVVNLSLNAAAAQSYHTSPMDAACEILWINGIVVVASAGNSGAGAIYPPANDPFVITVGAADDLGTPAIADDVMASFSAYGTTSDGVAKPDLVAPGKNLIAYVPENGKLTIGKEHPGNSVNKDYFRMSGTSVSTPIVSGAIALLLQDEPGLNPDQVKYRLKATANKSWAGYNAAQAGAGYLDIYAAVKGTTTATANTGLALSQFLFTTSNPANGGSANWGSANWGSANWGSANWGSANWGSANWGSDYWGQ